MLNTIGFEPLSDLKPGQSAFIIDIQKNDICQFLFDAGCFPGDSICVEAIETGLIFARVDRCPIYIPVKIAHHIITHPINLVICLN